jgi:NifB/MoaA-like Fe-S oxidoreductase
MSAYVSTAKPYKGWGMEGAVAKWYAALTKKSLEDFKALARRTAEQIPSQCRVLEVAPGPIFCDRIGETRQLSNHGVRH